MTSVEERVPFDKRQGKGLANLKMLRTLSVLAVPSQRYAMPSLLPPCPRLLGHLPLNSLISQRQRSRQISYPCVVTPDRWTLPLLTCGQENVQYTSMTHKESD